MSSWLFYPLQNYMEELIMTTKNELPQIRATIRGTKSAAQLAAEQEDMEKLSKVVEKAFAAIADATGLSEKEVFHAVEEIHGAALTKAILEAVKEISLATDLNTQQIIDIFTAKKDTHLNDIVNRLHERSQANRERFGWI